MTGSRGTNALAHVIREELLVRLASTGPLAEFGRIDPDGSLRVDGFGPAIPAGQYTRLAGVELQAGDRVVVLWTRAGEPVVLGRVG